MSNGGIQRINVDLVKNYFNNFEEEKDYYKNVTYNTFTSSYIKRCSDSRVSRMASRLLMQYKILDSSYNKIDKWWRQYNEAIESLETSLSQDVRSFVKESSTNSYVQSKLPKLEEYKSTLEDEINTTLAEVSSPIFENNTVITDVDVVSDVEENVIGDIWSDVNQDINDSKIEDNVSEDVTTGDYILSSNTKVIEEETNGFIDKTLDFFKSVYLTGANVVSNGKARLSEAMIKAFYGSDELEASCFESVYAKLSNFNYPVDELMTYYEDGDLSFVYQLVKGKAQIKSIILPNKDEINLTDKYITVKKSSGAEWTYKEDGIYVKNTEGMSLKLTKDGKLVEALNANQDTINIYDDFDQFGGDQMYFTYFNDQVVNDNKYLELLQEYFPGADIEDVEAFAYCLTKKGCGYTAAANEIYEYFEGREEEFLDSFGYSMYSVDSDGNLTPNYNYLIFEMVANRYQGQDIEEVYGDIMDVIDPETGLVRDGVELDEYNHPIYESIMKGAGITPYNMYIKKFCEEHGVNFSPSRADQYIPVSMDAYNYLITCGYHVVICVEDFALYDYDIETKTVGRCSHPKTDFHAMSVVGVADDGRYIVSSWGQVFVLDLTNATDFGGFIAVDISNENTSSVSSSDVTSEVSSIANESLSSEFNEISPSSSTFSSDVSASIDIVSEASPEEVSTVTSIFAKIKDKASNTLDDTIDLFKDVGAVVSTSAKGIYNGFSDWFKDTSDWWNNTALPKIKEISSNIGNVLVRCACTIDAGVFSLVEGILRVGEALVDAYAIFMTIQLMPFTVIRDLRNKLIGLIIGKDIPSITKGMWSKTKAFVSVNAVSTVFDKFYENTKYGSFIKENAYGFEKTRAIGSGFGYVTGIAITAFATGGLSVIAELGFSSSAITAIVAGIAGFGKNAERSWADGASTTEGLAVATAGGLWEAFQFWAGGKIGELALFKTGGALGNIIGDKGISILNLFSRVTLDSADGGVEAFVLPAIDAIYKDGYYDDNGNYVEFKDDDNFVKRFCEMFDDNGGWSTFEIQAATGAVASLGGEVFNGLFKKKTDVDLDTGNNLDNVLTVKTFEEQINEVNYHIQKGDILSYTFELDSFDDITPDVLSRIDDTSIVNFKVGDEVFDYYEIRKKLDFASPTVVTNITSYNKLPDNLKEYLSGLLTSEKGDYSVVKRLSDLLANAYENGDESTKTIVENFPFLSDVLDIKYLESLDGGTSSFVSFDKILGNKSAQFMNEIGFGKDFVYAHEIGHGLLEMIDNVTLPSNYDTVMDNLLKKWKENPIDLEDFLNTARDRQEDIWSRIRISTNEWMDANAKDIDDLIKKVIDDPKLLEEELKNSANRNMVSSSKIDEVVQGLLNNNNLNEIKEYIRRSFGTEHMWSNFTYECDADSTMGIYRIVLGLIDSAFNGDNPYYSTIYDNGFLRSHTQDYFSAGIAKSFNEQFADFTSMKLGNSKEAYQIVERLFGDEWLDMMENKYSSIAEGMKNHITDYDYDVGKNSIDSLFDLDNLNLYNESIFQRIKRFSSNDAITLTTQEEVSQYFNDSKQYLYQKLKALAENDTSVDKGWIQWFNYLTDNDKKTVSMIDENQIYDLLSKYNQLSDYDRTLLNNMRINQLNLTDQEKAAIHIFTAWGGPTLSAYNRKTTISFKGSEFNGNDIAGLEKYLNDLCIPECLKTTSFTDIDNMTISEFNDIMDNIIEKSAPLKDDILVYRGVDKLFFDGSELQFSDLKVGTIFNDQAHTSTSIIQSTIQNNNNYLLEITVPKGTKAAYLEQFTGVNSYNQQELLLGRDTKFKIIQKPIYNDELDKYIIKVEVVTEGF